MKTRVTTTRKPWHYTECGLDNVYLVGIEVVRDSSTGDEEPIIPGFEDLHRCIFLDLIRKPDYLTGRELRYLRRHLLLRQADAAEMLGYSGQQYIAALERRRSRAFGTVGQDFLCRYAFLEMFIGRTSGPRKEQAKKALGEFGAIRERLIKPIPVERIQILWKETEGGDMWESPESIAA